MTLARMPNDWPRTIRANLLWAFGYNAVTVPLAGINLIEANAGTGKTWAITALYVRLLLEAGREVGSILVVTFTEAATGELRDRIRKRLSEMRDAFERGAAADDDTLARVLLGRTADRADARLRLVAALRDFDQAPIYTIYAFCQRVLSLVYLIIENFKPYVGNADIVDVGKHEGNSSLHLLPILDDAVEFASNIPTRLLYL